MENRAVRQLNRNDILDRILNSYNAISKSINPANLYKIELTSSQIKVLATFIERECYTMTELSKENFWRPSPNYRLVTKAEQNPPYPPLYEEKKHKLREGIERLDPELKTKFKRTQDMWKARGGFDAWGWALGTKFQELK